VKGVGNAVGNVPFVFHSVVHALNGNGHLMN